MTTVELTGGKVERVSDHAELDVLDLCGPEQVTVVAVSRHMG